MKTFLILLISCVLIPGIRAQDDLRLSKAEIRKLQREQRRSELAAENEKMAELTKWLIDNQRFVLEADYIKNQGGSRIPVAPNINFLLVDSTEATMQLGSAFSAGYNGVGGTTLDGRITKYEVQTIGKNKDSWNISMRFQSAFGTYDISLLIGPTGSADANINSNWPGQLNYYGTLVPISQSIIYKGTPRL